MESVRRGVGTTTVFLVLAGLFGWVALDGRLPWAVAPAPGADWCVEHSIEESRCGLCHPELTRGGTYTTRREDVKEGECPHEGAVVHVASGASSSVGLVLCEVVEVNLPEVLRANAETAFAPARSARISPRLEGVVREVQVIPGQKVAKGSVLAVVESPEFGRAGADHLRARAVLLLRERTYQQEKSLLESKVTTELEMLRARTAWEEAKLDAQNAMQRLLALGVSSEEIGRIEEKQAGSPFLEVTSPLSGEVIEADVAIGENATFERTLFVVADRSRLWVSMDVSEKDLPRLAVKQTVSFEVDGVPGRRFPGEVVAMGGQVDERTRTIRVQAEVENGDGFLRAGMFGRAEITLRPPKPGILVPREAVQNDGDCSLIFVETESNAYEARKVELGPVHGDRYEIRSGLAVGAKVVTTGSFLLKSEVLRSQMGAG